MKPLILMDFKSKRLFCVLRPLVQLHSRLDKAAKSMRKEDAPQSVQRVITPELEHRKSGYVERKRRPYQGNVVRIA